MTLYYQTINLTVFLNFNKFQDRGIHMNIYICWVPEMHIIDYFMWFSGQLVKKSC